MANVGGDSAALRKQARHQRHRGMRPRSSRAQRAALSTRVDCILETVSGRVLLQSCCNLPPETPFCRARVRCELQCRWHVRCATVHERMRQCERDER